MMIHDTLHWTFDTDTQTANVFALVEGEDLSQPAQRVATVPEHGITSNMNIMKKLYCVDLDPDCFFCVRCLLFLGGICHGHVTLESELDGVGTLGRWPQPCRAQLAWAMGIDLRRKAEPCMK